MAAVPNENGGVQAAQAVEPAPLVVGAALPPSGLDNKFLKVSRDSKVYHAEPPSVLHQMDAPDWKDAQYLRRTFTKPPTRRQKKPQQSHYAFPICLILLCDSVRERLIVINEWLNMSKEKQKEANAQFSRLFVTPSKSAELSIQYDPENPKAIGRADKLELRKTKAQEMHSGKLLDSKKRRVSCSDAPKSNAQLRDTTVKLPESRAQVNLQQMIHRTRKTDENESNVTANFEPVLSTSSTAYSPAKGRPPIDARPEPKNAVYCRSKDGLARHLDALIMPAVRALLDKNVPINGASIVDELEQSDNHVLYVEAEKASWPCNEFLEKHKRENTNIISLDALAARNSWDDAAEVTDTETSFEW